MPLKGLSLKNELIEADLDPMIIESNSQATPIEELELFPINPKDLMKTLQRGNELNMKESRSSRTSSSRTWTYSHGNIEIWLALTPKLAIIILM